MTNTELSSTLSNFLGSKEDRLCFGMEGRHLSEVILRSHRSPLAVATRSGPPNSQVSLSPPRTIGQVMSYSPVSPSSDDDDVRTRDRQTDGPTESQRPSLSVSYFGNEANVAVRSHFRRQRESILFDTSSSRTESVRPRNADLDR